MGKTDWWAGSAQAIAPPGPESFWFLGARAERLVFGVYLCFYGGVGFCTQKPYDIPLRGAAGHFSLTGKEN
ncbi:hypothetical protein CS8_098980 [Cupriavidus sp. 8B]